MSAKNLTKHQIEIISETAIREFQVQKEKKKKELHDRRFKNVKLLLNIYRELKEYSADVQTVIEDFEEIQREFGFDEIVVPKSLNKHKTKTAAFMEFVDSRLEKYKVICEKGTDEEKRRWKIIYDMYLSPYPLLKANEIAEKYSMGSSTPYREVNQACRKLKTLFFGVDGLEGFFE